MPLYFAAVSLYLLLSCRLCPLLPAPLSSAARPSVSCCPVSLSFAAKVFALPVVLHAHG